MMNEVYFKIIFIFVFFELNPKVIHQPPPLQKTKTKTPNKPKQMKSYLHVI